MEKEEKQKKDNRKFLSALYVGIIMICSIVFVTLIILSAMKIEENKRLTLREQEIINQYQDLAKENENIKNEDYAKVYFDGENMYIPSKDIVIEYQP